MSKHAPILNLPNILTLIRVAAIPVLVAVFYLPFWWSDLLAAALFLAAGLTDWLDGYLARRLGQTSPFGAFLDPVADKLIVAVALVNKMARGIWAMLTRGESYRGPMLIGA